MAVEIREVKPTKGELKKFVRFGISLYDGNKYYVPSLVIDEINTLLPEKNPAFEFCEAKYFMAYKDGKAVGRIAGIINKQVNKRTETNCVRFGFVDFINDNEVVDALFDAVKAWGAEKGMDTIVGPLGFTDMDREAALVEGYEEIGTMATIYNYPYYIEQYERLKLERDAEWDEFRVTVPDGVPEKHQRISEIISKKYQVRNLHFTSKKKLVKKYGQDIFNLVNEAYDKLYCYSPLTPSLIDHYIKMYVPIVRLKHLAIVVDKDDRLIGIGLVMPSLAKALIKSRGRLFPFGWYHLLKALKGRNDLVDLLLIAVKPEYQSKGVNALIFNDLIPAFIESGYKEAETNPELNYNQRVQSQWQYFEYRQHKRRCTFRAQFK